MSTSIYQYDLLRAGTLDWVGGDIRIGEYDYIEHLYDIMIPLTGKYITEDNGLIRCYADDVLIPCGPTLVELILWASSSRSDEILMWVFDPTLSAKTNDDILVQWNGQPVLSYTAYPS